MVWARLEDDYASHPKLLQSGLEATGLDARAISHCSKYGTDGFVGDDDLAALAPSTRRRASIAQRLVDVSRWHRDETGQGPDCASCRALLREKAGQDLSQRGRPGYWVHDFLVYNPSRREVEMRRAAERDRKASGRKASGRRADGRWESGRTDAGNLPDSDRSPPGIQTESARNTTAPVPSRPVSTHKSSSSHPGVGQPGGTEDEEEAFAQTCRLIARRLLDRQPAGSVRNPSRWLVKVANEVRDEAGLLIRSMLAEGSSPEAVADAIEPPPEPAVKMRECCGTSVNTPHRIGCEAGAEPTWELDEHGEAVARR